MKEACKNCKYFLDKFLIKENRGLEASYVYETPSGKRELIHLNPWYYNDKGTGICQNKYSEFYEHCIVDSNSCDYFVNKDKTGKKNSNKKEKTGLSVFDNYTCDGQLTMNFGDNGIEFVEEST